MRLGHVIFAIMQVTRLKGRVARFAGWCRTSAEHLVLPQHRPAQYDVGDRNQDAVGLATDSSACRSEANLSPLELRSRKSKPASCRQVIDSA
jgi:hypothetical protein